MSDGTNRIAHGFFELVMFRVYLAVSSRYLREPKHYGIRNKFKSSSRQTTETNINKLYHYFHWLTSYITFVLLL